MSSVLPLIPEQASTLAPQVDQLYWFIIARHGVLRHPGDASWSSTSRSSTGPTIRSTVGAPITGSIPLELALVAHPVPHLDRDLRLGGARCSSTSTGRPIRRWRSTRPASAGCGSSSTSTARARSTSCTCRSAAPVKVTFTSEDVLHSLYFPSFRVKADAIPGPLQQRLVHGDEGRRVPHLLRRVLRHQALRDDRHGHVMEPAAYQAWLSGGGGGGRCRRAASGCSASWRATPATSATAPAAGRRSSNKFGTQEQLANGVDRHRRRELRPRVDPDAAGEARRRLPAADADVPGAGQRRERDGAHRVREVAAVVARRRRPPRRRRRAAGAPRQRRRTGNAMQTTLAAPRVTYLNVTHTVASWLLTKDHKRIGIMYLVVVTHRVLPRRHVRVADPARAGDAGGRPRQRPTPTTSCSRCTAWRWCSSSSFPPCRRSSATSCCR